jgi:hypothetical protein
LFSSTARAAIADLTRRLDEQAARIDEQAALIQALTRRYV